MPVVPLEAEAMTRSRGPIVVVAAVVERDGHFLVTRRLEGTHLSGLWEFPGGKCEPGESLETCLRREIQEELAVTADVHEEIVTTEHEYPERTVRLHFLRCDLAGDPQAVLGQEMKWVTREELRTLPLPEADRDLVEALTSRR
jgi:mutator protein MutT